MNFPPSIFRSEHLRDLGHPLKHDDLTVWSLLGVTAESMHRVQGKAKASKSTDKRKISAGAGKICFLCTNKKLSSLLLTALHWVCIRVANWCDYLKDIVSFLYNNFIANNNLLSPKLPPAALPPSKKENINLFSL